MPQFTLNGLAGLVLEHYQANDRSLGVRELGIVQKGRELVGNRGVTRHSFDLNNHETIRKVKDHVGSVARPGNPRPA